MSEVSLMMAPALMSQDAQQAWSALVEDVRTAVLLTVRNGRPSEKNALALRGTNLQGEAAILSPDAPSYHEV